LSECDARCDGPQDRNDLTDSETSSRTPTHLIHNRSAPA